MPQTAPFETSVWPPMPLGFLKPAANPLAAIELASYKGQPPSRKKWMGGYQHFFAKLPILKEGDPHLKEKLEFTIAFLQEMGKNLTKDPWIHWDTPADGEANRTIIAIEDPSTGGTKVLVVNKFGNGFKVPMHGHASGLFLDQMIVGKMKENHYRLMPNGKARITVTTIAETGSTEAGYISPKEEEKQYENHLHSLEAIGPAISFHYIAEYPKDGKGNGFPIEHFHQEYELRPEDVERIDTHQAMYLQKGDIVLVRSINVPEYGDHYIIVTGPPVKKPHGFRVQEFCMDAPNVTLLDGYELHHGVTLLKLKPKARAAFHEFHGLITTSKGDVKHL
jgi:hypothetical protein